MQEFVPGQRWINDAQLQMGLGSVLKTDFRTVTIIFLATGETIVYSKESVPLTRVRFAPGDSVITLEELHLEVVSVDEEEGLITYTGKDPDGNIHTIDESLLNNFIQLNRPTERLFNGQIDRGAWFEVRYQTRQLATQINIDPLRGLTGGRISLIPHQLYIAQTVSSRFAPRVLLADEVGLGKTIEAGMIVHQQLVTERVQRVLIVVPDALVHQWLVEMLRRFNLLFSVFNEERFDALSAENSDEVETGSAGFNPFLAEQLVLCSLEFLGSRPEVYKSCRDSGWDLMVVDEAHHLQWSESDPGFEYQLIEQLASATPGVLLLTATPEQLGKSSHFARLRLLDADRFHNYQAFLKEEEQYRSLADLVEGILDEPTLEDHTVSSILSVVGEDASIHLENISKGVSEDLVDESRDSLIQMLLDRHGTGRVLFRNTRNTIKGFPQRKLLDYPLQNPGEYQSVTDSFEDSHLTDPELLLYPELLYQAVHDSEQGSWTQFDPRVEKVTALVKALRPGKVLVIAASAETALDLADYLKIRQGIDVAVFHEGMSMIERDRAAAWFADELSGTHVMVCSEIGSEGRNFQFAHDLILFDLPLNPDLLEQRIGRLDRIGQKETVNIHVPYLQGTAQQCLVDWFHQGLEAFENTCPTGYQVFTALQDQLVAALHRPNHDYSELISVTHKKHTELMAALQQGRDKLLEFNSCRPGLSEQLKADAIKHDQQSPIQPYLETVFDCFGVDYEIHSDQCYAVNAGTHMSVPFPNLPEDGMTVTYSRDIALAFEDVSFLTWDHPLVTGAMDLVLANEQGNTAFIAIPLPGVIRGTLVLESIFVLESASTYSSHSNRYLPPTSIRVMIDQSGKRLDHIPSHRVLDMPGEKLKPEMVKRIISAKEGLLRKMISATEKFAQKRSPDMKQAALDKATAQLSGEVQRLEALSRVNANVRPEEIEFYRTQMSEISQKIDDSHLRLDALRVILAT